MEAFATIKEVARSALPTVEAVFVVGAPGNVVEAVTTVEVHAWWTSHTHPVLKFVTALRQKCTDPCQQYQQHY